MDFSNNTQNRQAPPPPPLPEGMTVMSGGANRQAPPPPPLPEGMTAMSGGANRQAPPPPPLPKGMTVMSGDIKRQVPSSSPDELPPPPIPDEMLRRARGNSEDRMTQHVPEPVQKQAPLPPPLPEGMMPMQNTTNRVVSLPNARGGRPTMSLSDAVNQKAEAERKAAEEAAKPCVNANGGRLFVNDKCYARSGMDGLYYYAEIESFDSEKSILTFFDDSQEEIKFEKIYTINEAANSMQCFANWNKQGNYYPAKIKSITENKIVVNYDENPDVIEELSFGDVRFALW